MSSKVLTKKGSRGKLPPGYPPAEETPPKKEEGDSASRVNSKSPASPARRPSLLARMLESPQQSKENIAADPEQQRLADEFAAEAAARKEQTKAAAAVQARARGAAARKPPEPPKDPEMEALAAEFEAEAAARKQQQQAALAVQARARGIAVRGAAKKSDEGKAAEPPPEKESLLSIKRVHSAGRDAGCLGGMCCVSPRSKSAKIAG